MAVENSAKRSQPYYRPPLPRIVVGIAGVTILEGLLSLAVLVIANTAGVWLNPNAHAPIPDYFLSILDIYYGLFLWAPALVIGILTFWKIRWTRPANMIFQTISIILPITHIALQYVVYGGSDGSRFFYFSNPFFILLAAIILHMLFKPTVKAYYQTLKRL